jgi:protein arginine kinase
MFDISQLVDGGVGWLDASGDHADIVLSTRVRLARNVEGYAFAGRARDGERLRVLAQVREAFSDVPSAQDGVLIRVDELDAPNRALLHERHIVSKELAGIDSNHEPRIGGAVQVGPGYAVMVNEEDHLRIQTMRSGLDLEQSFRLARHLDEALGQRVPFAYHKEFGFLTACPTNVGTGLRASV